MNIASKDVQILRELAEKYMSYAALPVQDVKRKMWIAHNARNSVKPMVLIDQMPWNELDVDGSLVCQVSDPYFRGVEYNLRCLIYKWEHLPVDMVLNPYIVLPRIYSDTGFGLSISAERINRDKTSDVFAYRFVNQFENPEDIEKIKDPVINVDLVREKEIFDCAAEIFDGIAPIKPGGVILHLGLWDFITQCMGIDVCYIEMVERPEMMHAIMERLTDVTIKRIERFNKLGLYDINSNLCHCSHTFSTELPSASCDPAHPTTKDGWAFGLAQLMSSVSPAMTEEFEVPYMQRLFPYFGAIYYGCCEMLDDRLDILAKMPNIRKISCSPWSNREHFAETLPKKYIMSNKPNPALLAGDTFDEEAVRADLRRTIRAAKQNGVCLEMILKDISTVRYDPKRLWRWAEIAREETENA